MRLPWITAGSLLLAAFAVEATVLRLAHPYGELIDRGAVIAHYEASTPHRIDCSIPASLTRAGRSIAISVRALAPGASAPLCLLSNQVSVGELEAGWWTVKLLVLPPAGSGTLEVLEREFLVGTPGTMCTATPQIGTARLFVVHPLLTGHQLAARVASDPAYAAALGDPLFVQPFVVSVTDAVLHYPRLENPHDLRARVLETGGFSDVEPDYLSGCPAMPVPDRIGEAVEYHHAGLDHYFYTTSSLEAAGLDGDVHAKGWRRTGLAFAVLLWPGCQMDRPEQGIYRFFGKPGVGPSSHVFTVDRRECRIVDRSGAWIFEDSPFWATPANARGGCTNPDEVPLHRLWKPFGESNHRFTTELAVVDEMKAKGWIHEGVAMCVKRRA